MSPGARRTLRILAIGAGVLVLSAWTARAVAKSRTWQPFGALVSRVETTDSVVALTFDDGPAAATMDTLLRILGVRDVRATFFVTGAVLAEHPEFAVQLRNLGHELANHSFTHRRMVPMRQSVIADEIERTDSLIREGGQPGDIWFRPPFGYKLLGLPWYLSRTGRTTIMWDIEPESYPAEAATAEGIVSHTLARVRPGSIILLHPWYPARATTLAAIGPLIDSLHARGYRVGTVSRLLRSRRSL